MAAATDTARGAPMEEENPTPAIAEEPPKKSEAAMDTTTEQAFVVPLEDMNPGLVVEEVPKIVEAVEKEVEAGKKGVVGAIEEEEEEVLERKDRGCEGLEAKNGEAEGGRVEDDHMKVEEAKKDGKVGILGMVEATKADGGGEMTKDIEIVDSMVEPTLMLVVEKKLETSELGDGIDCLASLDAVESEGKSDLLKEEQHKEESGVIVETEVEGDAKSIVTEEEKPKPKGRKGEDVGLEGGDGGNLGEEKVTEVSSVRIEAVEPKDKVAPFPKANNTLGYDKEATNDTMVVGGEKILKQSIGNDTIVEYETAKPEQCNKTHIMAMNDGSVEEVALENADSVLDESLGKKDADGQATTSEPKDEVGAALEEKDADKVSDDVESAVVEKEKQKQEGENSEEVGSLGGDDGELNKGKDVEILLSIDSIELEDKLAPLAETNEKLGYVIEGSDDIVDVNEGSAAEVTPTSAYHVSKDISKEHNAEGQATTSEGEKVHVVVGISVAEKVVDYVKSLLDQDAKPKQEGVKSNEIGSRGRDGGELDEEKKAKVSVGSMFVETHTGAMVVNDKSIEDIDLACEDSVLMGCSEKKQNTEGQTTENEVKEEVHVVLEPKVTYKVPNDIEFDMAEEEKAESEGEKREEIEPVGGNAGKLDEGKDIEVSVVSVEATELEDKLGPLAKTNEKIGYAKEESDDTMGVNEGSVEDISKKEHNVDCQAAASEAYEVGVIVEMYVADKMPTDAKSILAKYEKSELEGVKDEEVGSRGRDGGELDEEKEVEVSVASNVFAKPEASAMVVNDRIIGDVALASEDSVLLDSTKKKQNIEGQTTANEVKEEVHVVGEEKVTDNVPDYTNSGMDGEEKAKVEGKKGEETGSASGNGGELDEGKDVDVFVASIEAIELEDKLGTLAETNENFCYAKEGSDDILDAKKGSVQEVTLVSVFSVHEDIFEEYNVEGQATTSDANKEVGARAEMYVAEKEPHGAKSLLSNDKKPKLEGVEGKEVGCGGRDGAKLDEGEAEVSIVSIAFVEPDSSAMGVGSRVRGGVELDEEKQAKVPIASIAFVEQEACVMVVNDRSKEDVDLACEDISLMGSPEKKQNTDSNMSEEDKAETEGEKGEETGSVAGNGDELDEEKDVEVFTISIDAIELEDKLAPLTGTNKEVGYVQEGSNDIVVMDEGSVERVTPKSAYGVLEDISKKENSVEGEATASEAKEIGVVVEMYVADNVPDDAKSLLAKEEKPKLEGVKGEVVDYVDRDGGELDEKEGEVFAASIVFVEPEDKIASFSKANDELGFEKKEGNDRLVVGQEEASEESMDKSINIEDEAGKLKPSSEAGTMVVDDGSVDEVAPASAYNIIKNNPNKETNVEGQATTSKETEEVCVLMEAEVTNKVSDDMEHVVVEEEKAILEGEKGKEVGSLGGDGGELDEEKEVEIFNVIVDVVELEDKVANFPETSGKSDYTKKGRGDEVVVGNERAHKESTWNDTIFESEVTKSELESKASTVAMYNESVDEVEASAKGVLENSPWKEHNVEGQATISETEEGVGVIVETEALADGKSVVAKEEELQLESEKDGEVGSGDGDGGVLYVGKDLEVSVVSTAVVEPEDMVVSFSKSNDELGFEKEVNNDIVVMGDETPKESTKNDIYAEDDAPKLEQLNEMGTVISQHYQCNYVANNVDATRNVNNTIDAPIQGVNDGRVEEIAPTSADSVLKYSFMKEHNTKGQVTSSEMEEEVGLVVQGKVMDKELNEMESAVTEEKVELEGNKSEEVGSIGGEGDESDMEKKAKVSVVSVVAIEFEHKCASIGETNFKLGHEKKARDDILVVGDEEVSKESTKKDADIEKETSNTEPSSKASTVIMNDGILDELAPTIPDSVLKSSPIKEVNFEDQAIASEAIKDVGVKKPSKVENIATVVQDVGVKKFIEVENIVGAVKGVDVEKLIKAENVTAANIDGTLSLELPPKPIKENNDAEETKGATDVVHREEEFDDDSIIEVMPGYEDGYGNEGNEDDDELNAESNEATKKIMKEHVEGSSSGSVSSSRDFANSMDGQIMFDASKDDGDEKEFDSTTCAVLLNSENGASSDKNVIISFQDGSKILTMDRPAGLGSLAPSVRPTALNLLVSSELAVTADPTEEMTEKERKLHDKVELIRVKFLRLVYSLGGTPNEMVVTQVLYRLGLAEGIMHGRQPKLASALDNAWKKALNLEGEGKDAMNFSCNILVLGKTGVGKSATINSLFGEEKSKTDAFSSATTSVQEIVGDVHGVKVRIIDTPGLQPSVMDQGSNRKILAAVKKYTKKCPPDIVLYVDRLDCLRRDLNDLPLLKSIADVLGSSIWFNSIVALTHATSAPEDLNAAHISYEVLMAQTSHIIQQSIRTATGDMNLMNPVAFAENHSSCQRNHKDQKVLPNGQSWRHHMLLLCYSSKILSEANSLLKLVDPNPGNLFGLDFRSLPLPFLMSSLLELRIHPKLSAKQGGNEGDSDTELDGYFDLQKDDEEKEYDHLLAFKLLTKAQLAMLTTKKKNAYFDEYDYNVKLRPSFDCNNPTYRYRFLEPTSTVIARPVLDAPGWDHDCGYDGVSLEETLTVLDMFPANVAVQVTKDKKEFSIHLDSSIAAKHGENASSLACFDIQTIGHQLAYILRGEIKIKNIKKNKTTGGFSVTFLGDTMATGVKVEDQISIGKRLSLVASTGAIRAQGDTAYGAKLEAHLKDKANPIGQSLSTLGLSLMKWHQDLALGANMQSQFSIGRGSKMALRLGLNNKLSGQIGVKTSTSEQVQIALLGLVPIATSIYRSFQPSEPSFA